MHSILQTVEGEFYAEISYAKDVLYEQEESSTYVCVSDSSALLTGSWSTRQSSPFLLLVSHAENILNEQCSFPIFPTRF